MTRPIIEIGGISKSFGDNMVLDAQSGVYMLQDGRIDVYALLALSISDLTKKADDPTLEMFAPVEGAPIFSAGAAFRKHDGSCATPMTWPWPT